MAWWMFEHFIFLERTIQVYFQLKWRAFRSICGHLQRTTLAFLETSSKSSASSLESMFCGGDSKTVTVWDFTNSSRWLLFDNIVVNILICCIAKFNINYSAESRALSWQSMKCFICVNRWRIFLLWEMEEIIVTLPRSGEVYKSLRLQSHYFTIWEQSWF